ncbi:MAG: GspE/PulE family protein [Methylacidiphilales bacterium]|nr:GspE/PulE family protein [Candidatus Methylacidiphilales bacterium]
MDKILKSGTGNKIPLAVIIDGLLEDGIISKDSAQLSYRLISDTMVRNLGAIGALGSKAWPHAKDSLQRLDTEFISCWCANKYKLTFHTINPITLDADLVSSSLSLHQAQSFSAIIIEENTQSVKVATSEPFDTSLDQEIESIFPNKIIQKLFVNSDDLRSHIRNIYEFQESIHVASGMNTSHATFDIQNFEQLTKIGDKNFSDEDQAIISLVDWLLHHAISLKASDIHLEPHRKTCTIRFRIDGILNKIHVLPANVAIPIISRIKIIARMDVAERRRPQDGRIKILTQKNQEVEFRASSMPTAFGEKIVLRIFDPEVLHLGLNHLGLSAKDFAMWEKLIHTENGIVLVTGPTGSGKTTMLYTTLKSIATSEVNVSTIEDPIELIDDDFNQMQVNPKINVDFASGIKTLLRQDPDIIMVGEIRDREAAEIAAQASLTGHLVLSTLHTNDSVTAITRLRDLQLPNYVITNTLRGVLAMRLVRLLCVQCKKPSDETLPQEVWDSFIHPFKMTKPDRVYQPVGCKFCRNQGFSGRAGIFELLVIDKEIKALISQNANSDAISHHAKTKGLVPLRIAGAKRVFAGETTFEEVASSTPELLS